MPHFTDTSHPPFPTNIPIAALQKISLTKLLDSDESESKALFDSCQGAGFFVLDLRGSENGEQILKDVEVLFGFAEHLFDISIEEKLKYSLRPGSAFGYKPIGMSKIDTKGRPDRCEFWGFSKDEILSQAAKARDTVPLVEEYNSFLCTFTKRAHALCLDLLVHLEKHLCFAAGTLTSLHRLDVISSDQVRVLKMVPQPHGDQRTSLLAHTDLGSITLLWNVIGGLQILPPEAGDSDLDGISGAWEYVKPEKGCVVVNIGDAMVKLSGGKLRSNLHRVAAVPGEQGAVERYSVAYFMRPEDDILMRSFEEGGKDEGKLYTAKEWVGLKSDAYINGGDVMRSSGGK